MALIPLKPDFTDARGSITDLITDDQINAITRITFTKGAVRANHYHEHTVQWNYIISGEILLVSQTPGGPKIEQILKAGDFAVTREHERHALKGLSDTAEMLVFSKGAGAGAEYEKDTFRLDEPLVAAN